MARRNASDEKRAIALEGKYSRFPQDGRKFSSAYRARVSVLAAAGRPTVLRARAVGASTSAATSPVVAAVARAVRVFGVDGRGLVAGVLRVRVVDPGLARGRYHFGTHGGRVLVHRGRLVLLEHPLMLLLHNVCLKQLILLLLRLDLV